MTPWFFLLAAAVCEMVWPIGAKATHGFKDNYPIMGLTFAVMILSFWLMSRSIDPQKPGHIPVGTAYAVWTALGTAGTALLGMALYKEPHDFARILCLSLIITGVVGLKLLARAEAPAAATATEERPVQ